MVVTNFGKNTSQSCQACPLNFALSIELIALYYVYMHSLPYLVNKTGVRAIRRLYTCPVVFVFIHVQLRCSDKIRLQLAFFSLFKTSNREIESFFSYF